MRSVEPSGTPAVYDNICRLCADQGINLTELCRLTGVPRSTLSDLRNGRQKSLSTRNLNRIADYFMTTIDALLGNAPAEPPHPQELPLDEDLREYLEELRTRSEMRMLFSTTRGATREQIEAIVAMVEAMKKQGGK